MRHISSHPSRHPYRGWLACVSLTLGLAVILSLSGCIQITVDASKVPGLASVLASSSPVPRLGAQASTPSGGNESHIARVGGVQVAGAWEVQVYSATTSQQLPSGARVADGHECLLVEVGFKNTKPDALIVKPSDFSLRSSSGELLKPVSAPVAYNAQSVRAIEMGLGSSTVFAYDIPSGAHGFLFTFAPEVNGHHKPLRWRVP